MEQSFYQLAEHQLVLDRAFIVAVTDERGVITRVNKRFCDISGYTTEELIGRTHSVVNSGHHPSEFFGQMWSTIRRGEIWQGDIKNRRKDGSFYWVETTIFPFRNSFGEIFQYLSVRNEITDFKKAQQTILEQQERLAMATKFSALGELAANLTHELNNPLSAILGRCELLLRQLELNACTPESLRTSIEAIEVTAHRIEKIVKSMKSFSGASGGDPMEPVLLAELVQDSLDFVAGRLAADNIELIVNAIDPNIIIECRYTEISQILINLINNAHDAVNGRSNAWVAVDAQIVGPNCLQISVTDSGHGIPEPVRLKMFNPFFSTKEKQYGTGLGLSISKGLIKKHGGSLRLDPHSVNTRFLLKMPLKQNTSILCE